MNNGCLRTNATMKLPINPNVLKPIAITIAAVGTVGLGYLGCQVFGKTVMVTTAGCLGGLGGTAALIEIVKPHAVTNRKGVK